MPLSLAQLEPGSLQYACSIALVAMLLDAIWRWPEKWHPLTLVRILAIRMAQKVQPAVSDRQYQHWISGSLAFLVLFGPMLIVLYVLIAFAAYGFVFELILLLTALSFANQRHYYQRVLQALSKKQKLLAREWLENLVKRETRALSDIGIAKAAMESYLLRYCYQYVTVIVMFLIGGIILALVYRLLLECRWQWQRPTHTPDLFIQPVSLCCRAMQWLPSLFVIAVSSVLIWPRNTKDQQRQNVKVNAPTLRFNSLGSLILNRFGKRLGFALGGPVQYGEAKRRFRRLGAPYQVKFSDMHALKLSLHSITLCLILILGFGAVYF